jgi:hypothetical protein
VFVVCLKIRFSTNDNSISSTSRLSVCMPYLLFFILYEFTCHDDMHQLHAIVGIVALWCTQ